MPKKVVSFAIEPDEKARIDAVIKRRRRQGPNDRELKFSKWMRDAVIEKLEREETILHIVSPPTTHADELESYKARGRRAGEK